MIEVILTVIIVVIILGHLLYVRDAQALIKSLTKAVMAKDLRDFDISEKGQSNIKRPVEVEQGESEFVSIDLADSKLFDRMLQQELNKEPEENGG